MEMKEKSREKTKATRGENGAISAMRAGEKWRRGRTRTTESLWKRIKL